MKDISFEAVMSGPITGLHLDVIICPTWHVAEIDGAYPPRKRKEKNRKRK